MSRRLFSALPRFTSSAAPSTPLHHASTSTNTFTRHASTFSNATKATRSRPFVVVLGVMPIFCFGLGTWQVKRLQWKLDMIERLEDKLNKPPVGLPAKIDPAAIPEFAYRKVYLEGEFDHEHEIVLGPKTRENELGYHVITPLKRGEGKDTVLVNRGFVKRVRKDRSERPESSDGGKVKVIGMLRDQERSGTFTPANTPEKEEWVFADIKQMAEHSGAEPVLVDQIFVGHAGEINRRIANGVPVGRSATIELRNQHVSYIMTWYALSAATAFMFFRLVRTPNKAISTAQWRGVK
ncbi:COX1 assembly protein, Shy1 [Pseudohyphozyma bogoriensis]|nr:COX1 assembly protein, Shy1 [Pseudohyphozyma bogoriensis]